MASKPLHLYPPSALSFLNSASFHLSCFPAIPHAPVSSSLAGGFPCTPYWGCTPPSPHSPPPSAGSDFPTALSPSNTTYSWLVYCQPSAPRLCPGRVGIVFSLAHRCGPRLRPGLLWSGTHSRKICWIAALMNEYLSLYLFSQKIQSFEIKQSLPLFYITTFK